MARHDNMLKILAFAAIYLVWGSTYLAIKLGIASFPPFAMAGARFVLAGVLLFGWALLRGAPWPTASHWRSTLVMGTLLLFGGNGLVTLGLRSVPSGLAAVLIATVPLWMVVLDAVSARKPISRPVGLGLILGLAGVAVLMAPSGDDMKTVDPWGAMLILGGAASWAVGSLRSRVADLPASAATSTGMQMLGGGGVLLVASLIAGEAGTFNPAEVNRSAVLAFVYLVSFGSIVAFSAYVWLLRVSSPASVSTYAFVNPLVAVMLGWMVGETLTPRTGIAAAFVVGAVVLLQWARNQRSGPPRRSPEPCRPAINQTDAECASTDSGLEIDERLAPEGRA